MKTRTKKVLLVVLLSIILCFAFVACGESDNLKSSTLTLSKNTLNMNKFTEDTLIATVSGSDEKVIWTSSATDVVSVSNGKLKAIKGGKATITATITGASAICTVTVVDDGSVPSIITDVDSVGLFIDNNIDIGAVLRYKNVDCTDASFSYVSDTPLIATVSETGRITAVKPGKAEITVKAKWRDVDAIFLTKIIEVTVNEDVSVVVQEDGLILFVSDNVDGSTFEKTKKATVSVSVDGNIISNPIGLVWESEKPSIATINDSSGQITAVTEGDTKIRAKYTTSSGTITASEWKTVKVSIPVVDKLTLSKDIDKSSSSECTALNDIFASGVAIIRVTDVTDATTPINLQYNSGIIDNSKLVVGERTLEVLNANFGYKIKVIVASQIITTPEQLAEMYTGVLKTDTVGHYAGYILLGADLDFTGFTGYSAGMWGGVGFSFSSFDKEVKAWDTNWADTTTKGFNGTFDGRGHTINNLNVCTYGIFPAITEGSIFKNVAFTDVTLFGETAVIAAINHGTIDNVYIGAKFNSDVVQSGVVTLRSLATSVLSNTIVYAPNIPSLKGNGSTRKNGVISRFSAKGCTLTNVYAISNPISSTIDVFHNATNGSGTANTGILYNTIADFATEKNKITDSAINLTGLNSYWDTTTYQIPVFVGYSANTVIPKYNK